MAASVKMQMVPRSAQTEVRTLVIPVTPDSPTDPGLIWDLVTLERREATLQAVVSVCINLTNREAQSTRKEKERDE